MFGHTEEFGDKWDIEGLKMLIVNVEIVFHFMCSLTKRSIAYLPACALLE